jgi:hypothetical protein
MRWVGSPVRVLATIARLTNLRKAEVEDAKTEWWRGEDPD